MPNSPLAAEIVAELEDVGGGPEFVDTLLESLVADLIRACNRLPNLIADDPKQAAREAHRLKSAAGTVGATTLHHTIALVNDALRSDQPHRVEAFLPAFYAAATELIDWVEGRESEAA